MLTFDEARSKAQAKIGEIAREMPGKELVLLDDRIEERARGWAFPFNTKRFTETHQPLDGLVGNGPIFVDKNDGTVYVLPSGGYRTWLDEYDRSGIPPPSSQGLRWIGAGQPPSFLSPKPGKAGPRSK